MIDPQLRRLLAVTLFVSLPFAAVAQQALEQPSTKLEVSSSVSLSEEAYLAWNGDFDNPEFSLPADQAPDEGDGGSIDLPVPGTDPGPPEYQYPPIGSTLVAEISCSINVQNPHAGSGPGGRTVVKAKSSGSCTLTPTWNGPPPPASDMRWTLVQQLYGEGKLAMRAHIRTGYSPVWSASSTQVFLDDCVNGDYTQFAGIFPDPPWPWQYSGPYPAVEDTNSNSISACP
ncbi:MAG: hypothetical protein F4Y26_14805 [Gammaproteobacteria bacterium]|nr:hypothetical protein [Gammaproteobacteria bacterium]